MKENKYEKESNNFIVTSRWIYWGHSFRLNISFDFGLRGWAQVTHPKLVLDSGFFS